MHFTSTVSSTKKHKIKVMSQKEHQTKVLPEKDNRHHKRI